MKYITDQCKCYAYWGNKFGRGIFYGTQTRVNEEKDLRVMMSIVSSNYQQCNKAITNGNQIFGLIKETITCRKGSFIKTIRIFTKVTLGISRSGFQI